MSFVMAQVSRSWRDAARHRKSLVLGIGSGSRFIRIDAALRGEMADEGATEAILALARQCHSLTCLDLSGCPCCSDKVLAAFAPVLDATATVDISGCSKVTLAGFGRGIQVKEVNTERCWRLHSPNTYQTASEVAEIQILALGCSKDDEDAGFAKCFEFASPLNKTNTGPLENFSAMIRQGFPIMQRWETYSVNPLPTMDSWSAAMTAQDEADEEGDDRATLQVSLRGWDGSCKTFFWFLSKHEKCWMTDSVLPAAAVQGDIG